MVQTLFRAGRYRLQYKRLGVRALILQVITPCEEERPVMNEYALRKLTRGLLYVRPMQTGSLA